MCITASSKSVCYSYLDKTASSAYSPKLLGNCKFSHSLLNSLLFNLVLELVRKLESVGNSFDEYKTPLPYQ